MEVEFPKFLSINAVDRGISKYLRIKFINIKVWFPFTFEGFQVLDVVKTSAPLLWINYNR